MPAASTEEVTTRRLLGFLAIGCALFVVYGSLIPFDFEPRSFDEIISVLLASNKNSILVSLTDRAINICLLVPLAFFALGASTEIERPLKNAAIIILIWLGCITLAITVETLQALTPSRVASMADILAQAMGALIGIFLWACFARPFSVIIRWLLRTDVMHPNSNIVPVGAVWVITFSYSIALFVLNGWLTSNWKGLDAAWNVARNTSYLPFFYQYSANIFTSAASVAKVIILYSPIGIIYWIYPRSHSGDGNRNHRTAAIIASGVALVVETGKFFLPLKHPDVTNVLLAACASAASSWLLRRIYSTKRAPSVFNAATVEKESLSFSTVQSTSLRFTCFRFAAILSFGLTALGIIYFPLGASWLGVAIAIYTLAMFRYPAVWLIVIPALLPSFDLAPWTGWFFVTELDLFILATIGAGLWLSASAAPNLRQSPSIRLLLFAFTCSTLLSLFIGLLPLQILDFNAFGNYYSRYNALRAAKGMFEALALLPIMTYTIGRGYEVMRYFSAGMVAGLATAVAASVWERALFPGLFDFTSNYRISALFSSMHTGDSAIEAYLVAALPFIASWAFYRKSLLSKIVAAILFGVGSYAILVTFSRGGYAAYALIVVILVVGTLLASKTWLRQSQRTFVAIIAVSTVLSGLMALVVMESSFARVRFSTTESDLGVRLRHWRQVIAMMDQDWGTSMFGMGLGRYPDVYFHRNWSVRMPSSVTFATEGNSTFLRLGPGVPAYLEQIVPVAPNTIYKLSLDFRPISSPASLNGMICQRTFFRSFNCKDVGISSLTGEQVWTHHEASINSGRLGEGPWFARRIVKFVLENTSNDTAVDVDNIKLIDNRGDNLLANGDFSRGSTFWFYSSFDHLNWHIKNIFVQVLFEQGWVGLVLFCLLAIATVASLWVMINHGKIEFLVPLASLCAMLSVGFFGSPLDTPRLAFLFYFTTLVADLCVIRNLSIAEEATHSHGRQNLGSHDPSPTRMEQPDTIQGTVDRHVSRNPSQSTSEDATNEGRVSSILTGSSKVVQARSMLIKIFGGMSVFVVSAWVLMHSSVVPYNVRDLLHPVHPILSLVALACFLYWSIGFPVITTFWLTHSRQRAISYPVLLVCHSIIAWFLLSYSVSFDRIHKIVGTPVLGWHWYWEPAGRFIALFTAISMSVTCGTLIAMRLSHNRKIATAFIVWTITAAAISPFLYWIVISKAATDNLIELMAGNGTVLAAVLLCMYLATMTFEGSLLAAQTQQRLRDLKLTTLLALALSVPIACLAIYFGTEQHLEKYGKVFSALQFLLSRDRENYAQGFELMARYFVFHVAIIGLVFMIQYPFFSGSFGSANKVSENRPARRTQE